MPANLNLRHLEALIAIARAGNFTRAAQALHISQPSLTVQIRQLEDALGVRLLDRNTRSVRLTQIGRELTPVIDRLVREVDSVVLNARDLATGNRGLVTVAALPSISATILPRIIGRFREESPGVSVMLRDVVAQRVLAMVKSDEADFGIGSFPDAEADIHTTPLFTDRMRVVFSPGSPLEKQRAISLKQLTGLPMILMDRQSSVRTLVNRAFESIGHFPVPAYEVTYMSTAVGMVKAGLGISFLPSSALEVEELRGVRSRILHHPGLTRKIVVARSAARSLTPAAASFIRTLTAFCRTLNSGRSIIDRQGLSKR